MNAASVAVVGAGLAGIACARALRDAGVHCRVFESRRGPGGRLATRRFAAASFDHGAQYLTATDDRFRSVLEAACDAGAAGIWVPDFAGKSSRDLWVGVPAMSALPRFLAQGLDIEYGAHITRVDRMRRRGWALLDDRGVAHSDFTAIVLALPAPDAAALASGRTQLAARVKLVAMAPCWAAMAAFEPPLTGMPDAASPGDPTLAWFARDGSKPGRVGADAWVLHASADWSRAAFDRPAASVQDALLERFLAKNGQARPRLVLSDAHRWRHARVETPLGEPFLFDADAGLAFCGDWCLDARAEAAWLSGTAVGAELAKPQPAARSGRLRGSR
jgi:renalase